MDQVNRSRYDLDEDRLPGIPDTGFFEATSLFSKSFLYRTFAHPSDFLPEGRKKVLHPAGSTASFEFVPEASSIFTGVFQGGIGIARLSLAGNEQALKSYTPGMALKFLIDGRPSLNIQVMNRLEGQGQDRNFFSLPLSNHIPSPESTSFMILEKSFERVLDPATHLPLGHLSQFDRSGLKVSRPMAPWQIVLKPSVNVQKILDSALQSDAGADEDHRIQLSRIPKGATLYEVHARFQDSGALERIGKLVLTSPLVPSRFGDEVLFFQHHW